MGDGRRLPSQVHPILPHPPHFTHSYPSMNPRTNTHGEHHNGASADTIDAHPSAHSKKRSAPGSDSEVEHPRDASPPAGVLEGQRAHAHAVGEVTRKSRRKKRKLKGKERAGAVQVEMGGGEESGRVCVTSERTSPALRGGREGCRPVASGSGTSMSTVQLKTDTAVDVKRESIRSGSSSTTTLDDGAMGGIASPKATAMSPSGECPEPAIPMTVAHDKGKAKLIPDPRPQAKQRSADEDVATGGRSSETLADKSIHAHQQLLKTVLATVTCQICLDPMYKPWTLAPCGHTACFTCLVSWFRAPPPNVVHTQPQFAQHFDPKDTNFLAMTSPLLLRKKKTCPHCRSVVREAPIEAWGTKSIVASLQMSGLLQGMAAPPADTPLAGAAGAVQREPWQGIFRKHAPPGGGAVSGAGAVAVGERLAELLAQAHVANAEAGEAPVGFFDEEDGVHRCTACFHEIWDGVCSSCHRVYPGHGGPQQGGARLGRRGDVLDLMDQWWDVVEDEVDNDDDDDGHFGGGELQAILDRTLLTAMNQRREWARAVMEDEERGLGSGRVGLFEDDDHRWEDSEEEDGSYDGSFIDDDGEDRGPPPRLQVFPAFDEDIEDDDVDTPPRPLRAAARGTRPVVVTEDEEEEGEVAGAIYPGRSQVILDNEDDEDEVALRVPRRGVPPGRRRQVAIVSDDDSDEGDMPERRVVGSDGYDSDVGALPLRRSHRSLPVYQLPVESDEGESDPDRQFYARMGARVRFCDSDESNEERD